MAQFKISRGNSSKLDSVEFQDGRAYLTTDEGGLFFDAIVDGENKRIRVGSVDGMAVVTLQVANWDQSTKTQTVTVQGILADETAQAIHVTPHEDTAAFSDGVYCSAQEDNALVFTYSVYAPIEDLKFIVEWTSVKIAEAILRIEFYVDNWLGGLFESGSFIAESGMTWAEFIESDYNPSREDGTKWFYVNDNGYVIVRDATYNGDEYVDSGFIAINEEDVVNDIVHGSDVINPNYLYSIE